MNTSSSSPIPPTFSYVGPAQSYRPVSRRRRILRRSVPYVVTFILGAGVGASGSSDSAASSSQLGATPVPTVVYSPTPVPTVVYSPSPVPTVIYSPVPVSEAPAVSPSAVPAPPAVEQTPETSEEEPGGGASSGTEQAPAQSEPDSGSAYYSNCKAARDAGAAPIYRGQPGYRPELDRDKDGIACEPK